MHLFKKKKKNSWQKDAFRFLILVTQLWEIEATSDIVHRHPNYETQTWR